MKKWDAQQIRKKKTMTAASYGILLLLLITSLQSFVHARRLNRFVLHFEPLSYEPRRVHREHVRVRRSLGGSDPELHHGIVHLRFQGFDRFYVLEDACQAVFLYNKR